MRPEELQRRSYRPTSTPSRSSAPTPSIAVAGSPASNALAARITARPDRLAFHLTEPERSHPRTPPRASVAKSDVVFIQFAYSAQLALRQLQTLSPNPDYPPLDPLTMRSIVRQVIGLDVPVFMNHAKPGVEWYTITQAGISETYGTLSSGYDGRYGSGVPVKVGAMVALSRYDIQ